MTLLLGALAKAAVLLALALLLELLLHRRSAALRHWIVTVALVCTVVVAGLSAALPQWELPPRLITTAVAEHLSAPAASPPRAMSEPQWNVASRGDKPAEGVRFWSWVLLLWAAGVVTGIAVSVTGLLRIAQLARHATPVVDPRWRGCLAELSARYGIRRPVGLLCTVHPSLLAAWGHRRPAVLIPASALEWEDDRIRIVLAHELAHIVRADWLLQLTARALRTLFWINPLAWRAVSRQRLLGEQACDDEVLSIGVLPTTYARELIEIARCLSPQRIPATALPLIRPSGLHRRVSAMLNVHANRASVSRPVRIRTALGSLVIAVPLAAASLGAQSEFARFIGTISDQTGAALPAATVAVTNASTGQNTEIRSDRTGRFEIVGLPAGEYVVTAQVPGFSTFTSRLSIQGGDVERDLTLYVGRLEETLTVTPERDGRSAAPGRSLADASRAAAGRSAAACEARGATTPALGGMILPPRKLVHVIPLYPAAAAAEFRSAQVRLEARIGTDGRVSDVEVQQSGSADFDAAAVDAIRQWEFSETLLNCVPVEVSMMVNVAFDAARR